MKEAVICIDSKVEMCYDNIEEMIEDIEVLALYVLNDRAITFRVDSSLLPDKPYKLTMQKEDYEELCQRQTRK